MTHAFEMLYYAVPHNNQHTHLGAYKHRVLLKLLPLILCSLLLFFLYFCSPSSYALFHTFLSNVAVLHYRVFTKAVRNQISNWFLVG
jgi:hypothetical protein